MENEIKWWMFELNGVTCGPTTSGSEDELKRRIKRLVGRTIINIHEVKRLEIEKRLVTSKK